MRTIGSLALLFSVHGNAVVDCFAPPRVVTERKQASPFHRQSRGSLVGASSSSEIRSSELGYDALFEFSDSETGEDAVSQFDRIDDAIMGGISTSSLRFQRGTDGDAASSYASWSGVCRLDGGGFCGTRTLPFLDGKPLDVGTDKEGFYLVARLASDDEPEKRVWKMTTRNLNNARSEQLYQAEFQLDKTKDKQPTKGEKTGGSSWQTIRVPFSSFVQVKGPRKVENGPPLDPSGGLFQIGMSLSKFKIASNTTELPNFRPGYFELQIREIGVYGTSSSSIKTSEEASGTTTDTGIATTANTNDKSKILTVTKKEAEQQRPAVLKIVFPLVKFFFNEQRNRRKSATRLLKKRGLNQLDIALFGIRRKAASKGIVWALGDFLVRLLSTTVRLTSFWTLKIALFYPFVTIRKILRKVAAVVSSKPATNGELSRE
uniref:NADH:ubiquinone oxidoreductase intermediate-associated protein 30 domain-containing protein n=1 Tax=Pseudo-nitzschia australis TaxID=44445 RepID=A0A7S4ACN5_9STRA|mmetsp:Transcript_9047/g.19536  ORF Transcript_9047/g.19536 Transcript_9047/m.19536 type:complete len:432 (+) Transcript_9047:126-1421(+)